MKVCYSTRMASGWRFDAWVGVGRRFGLGFDAKWMKWTYPWLALWFVVGPFSGELEWYRPKGGDL